MMSGAACDSAAVSFLTFGALMNRCVALIATIALTVTACADHPVAPAITKPLSPPSLIVNGAPDTNNTWSAVGALLLDSNGDGQLQTGEIRCTGTLISPTRFLTAAHCVYDLNADAKLAVSFHSDLGDGSEPIPAVSFVWDPSFQYNESRSIDDLAIVTLPSGSTAGIQPMLLPSLQLLKKLKADGTLRTARFTSVGYGNDATLTNAPGVYPKDFLRHISSSPFMSLITLGLGLHTDLKVDGDGGICYGDSGGPTMLAGAEFPRTVMGVAMTADVPCRATSWYVRVDTPEARSFLGQFVTLP